MTPERPSNSERFEKAHIMAAGADGRPLMVIANMPRAEYYSDEITRLTGAALNTSPVQELGYLDSLGTVVNFRERIIKPGSKLTGPYMHQIGEYTDAGNGQSLQIRYVAIQPITIGILGRKSQPTEIKWYFPSSDTMHIVRFDDLNPDDIADPSRLEEMVAVESALSPILPTKKDRFFFYSGLVGAAGERLPK